MNPKSVFHRFKIWFSVVVFGLAANGVGAARWYEDYELAVEQISRGECSPVAIEALGAAVVDKPKPRKEARTYAARRIDYLPYYQLAKAHLLCANLELAQQYIEKSRSFGVSGSYELTVLESRIDGEIQARVADSTPEPVDAEDFLRRFSDAGQRLEKSRTALADVNEAYLRASPLQHQHPEWAQRRDAAAERIDEAAQNISESEEAMDLLSLADATSAVTEAWHDLQNLKREIESRHEIWQLAQITPTPVSSPVLAAVRPTPTVPPAVVSPLSEPRESIVPAELRRAATAYFAADYQVAVDLLKDAKFGADQVQAAALLLRGAARLALADLGGAEADREMRGLAHADLDSCGRLSLTIRPNPQLFPPSVVLAFEATVASQ
ncbi:MAG: hypothetical protein K8R59_08100 [Thermoanaerobaculales bacterium]|nr:hypothetical protein [Thermoanaerobaculales bacterium]